MNEWTEPAETLGDLDDDYMRKSQPCPIFETLVYAVVAVAACVASIFYPWGAL